MHVGLVGSGPAVDAVEAALSDIDATVRRTALDELDGVDAAAVVAPVGSGAFTAVTGRVETAVAVEIGGVGGVALDGLDAAVSAFDAKSGCFDCLRARVAAALEEAPADEPRGDRSAVRFAGARAGRLLVEALAGGGVGGTVVEVPGPERRFLPVPGCDCGRSPGRELPLDHEERSLEEALERAERGYDERVGVVTAVGEQESFPLPYYVAQTSDTTVFSDVRAAEFGGGAAADWNGAFMKALGEAYERYCAGIYRGSSFTEAPARNVPNPVRPDEFVRPEGYEATTPETRLAWIDGIDLSSGERASLPAEFVYYPPADRRFKPAITTGLGLGNSGVEAVLSGLYEVIERDATMLAWYSTFEPLRLTVDDERFDALAKRARAESLAVTPLLVTQDVDVPVVAVAVHREGEAPNEASERRAGKSGAMTRESEGEGDWPRFAAGSGADLDPAAAARSALAEALQNWTELRGMGPEAADDEGGAIGRYADFPRAARRFVDADATVPASSLGAPDLSGRAELDAVVERVAEAELDTYAARVTTRDVAEMGFEAVRVLVPAAQPLFTGDPYFGDRARRVPTSMGFEPRLDRPYHPYP